MKTRGPKIAPPRKRSRKPWIILKIILCVLAVMALIVGFFYIQLRSNLNSPLKSKKTRETYCISDEAADVALNHRVVNVLVFGLDGREADEDDDGDLVTGDRSDAMMICSADFENGAIKITSLMRDTFVWIDSDQTYDKLNASYAFGGPEGAIKTINQNFDTAITDYVSINFEAMVFMVDAVGGVEITFDDPDEVYWTNQYTGHVCAILGREWTQIISGTGTHTLDGCQALGYCRERYTGNGDFDRTQRQRNVLQQVITKALTLSPPEQLNLLTKVMPYLETSLDMNRIIKYGLNVLSMESKTISQMRLPTNDYGCDGMLNDVYYFYPDTLADNIKAFYQYIYKIDYTPSDTAQKISDEIASIEFDDSPY